MASQTPSTPSSLPEYAPLREPNNFISVSPDHEPFPSIPVSIIQALIPKITTRRLSRFISKSDNKVDEYFSIIAKVANYFSITPPQVHNTLSKKYGNLRISPEIIRHTVMLPILVKSWALELGLCSINISGPPVIQYVPFIDTDTHNHPVIANPQALPPGMNATKTPSDNYRKINRLSALVEIGAWKNPRHPALRGIVEITNMTPDEMLLLSLGRGNAPTLTQQDLREYVFETLDIYAVTHRHRTFVEGDPGFGTRNEAGLSRKSADFLANLAKNNLRKRQVRTAVWVDNFHTRLRATEWGPECLLPYLMFSTVIADVTEEERKQRMWLHLEKRMMESTKQHRFDRDFGQMCVYGVRQILLLVALELSMGKFDDLEASYEDDKRKLKEWASNNLEFIPLGKINTDRGVDGHQSSIATQMNMIANMTDSFSNVCCVSEFRPLSSERSWNGSLSILRPDIASFLNDDKLRDAMILCECKRVADSSWIVVPSAKRAIAFVARADSDVQNLSILVCFLQFEHVDVAARLYGKVAAGQFRQIPYIVAKFLKSAVMSTRKRRFSFAAFWSAYLQCHENSPLKVRLERKIPSEILDFIHLKDETPGSGGLHWIFKESEVEMI